jgi:hypothetical protein
VDGLGATDHSAKGYRLATFCPNLAWAHAHETLLWASKSRYARHTFNYDPINRPQVSSIWCIPTVPKHETRMGYHPTQKPLRFVRRALLTSTGASPVRRILVEDQRRLHYRAECCPSETQQLLSIRLRLMGEAH